MRLRGDLLDLKGAKCLFWVFNQSTGTRWHFAAHPLSIAQRHWNLKQNFVLANTESDWHRSWSRNPNNPASLDQVLQHVDSYGFSFVGFSSEVAGKFSMDDLEIELN